jgi:hypothetical protein
VRSAIDGVVREAVIAAALTGAMILLFIGSWRSTLIIAISIPLSILSSILVLSFLHETINIMTLGGLALAVGILVDDATVEIENINRILETVTTPKFGRPFWMAPSRSPYLRSFRRCASASSLCRCFCLAEWPDICSFRWRRRWSLPCSLPTFFRERWCRRW